MNISRLSPRSQTPSSPAAAGGGSIIFLWFVLIGLLPGMLCADAPSPASVNQTETSEQKNELAWPKEKLLYPALKWKRHLGVAEKCLNVCGLDPEDHETNTSLLFAVDLPGEWFEVVNSTDVADPGPGRQSWNYNGILQQAGYKQNVPIPDKQICLVGQSADGPDGGSVGYIKRAGKNIRLILIDTQDEQVCDEQTLSNGPACTPAHIDVFVSNITPLEQILKDQR
jgi:hypothetical protein